MHSARLATSQRPDKRCSTSMPNSNGAACGSALGCRKSPDRALDFRPEPPRLAERHRAAQLDAQAVMMPEPEAGHYPRAVQYAPPEPRPPLGCALWRGKIAEKDNLAEIALDRPLHVVELPVHRLRGARDRDAERAVAGQAVGGVEAGRRGVEPLLAQRAELHGQADAGAPGRRD